MMVKADQRHLYVQVIERLKKDIESGIFKENERFPSEFELARTLGVSRATLREALRVLEEDKVIVRKHGVGTFVKPKPLFSSGIENLTSVSSMIRDAGMEPGTIFMDVLETIPCDESIAKFGCSEDERLVTIKRVRTADGDPVVYCIDKVLSKNLSSGTDELLNNSLFDAIEKSGTIRIVQAVAHIEPVGYDDEASSILRCGIDVPLLVLRQHHYSEEGEMVLYSKNYFRADKFSFHVVRKRV
ncbi:MULTISPECIES: GntR family transcriptional regulator [Sporosarcina]|uniref:GntR family transcriptional regulator n=1 Tax=Sporosarcina psychrophila TaxID=1476 RepID=A0ABV2K514_SPOPS|nr:MULTISPECIES: GntR family transcriptional regulator [Sporosarcina]AMQ07176.1 GntR family transcriptional regulator [Sporosarcina psychrophila]QNK86894.1 GntR family transcriptional regulator [Sporosarcina sp. resist]